MHTRAQMNIECKHVMRRVRRCIHTHTADAPVSCRSLSQICHMRTRVGVRLRSAMLWGALLPAPESPHRISPRPLFTTPTSPAGIPAWHTARAQTKNANVAEKPLRISAMLASKLQITPVCLNTPLCESVASVPCRYTLVSGSQLPPLSAVFNPSQLSKIK